MFTPSVVTLFCEDVRDEKAGSHTIVGVFPDNVNVPSFPHVFPKISIYTRITIDVNDAINQIRVRISLPDEKEESFITTISGETITKSQKQSADKGFPIVGFLGRLVAQPLEIPKAGLVRLLVSIDDQEHLGGFINVAQTP